MHGVIRDIGDAIDDGIGDTGGKKVSEKGGGGGM